MRLDKFLSETSSLSRKEAARAIASGRVTVNGQTRTDGSGHIDETADRITLDGVALTYTEFVYVMLNKPEGYVSATEDGHLPTVVELLPEELRRREVFPCGRLDRDTVGLMILTDDGALSHRLLAPKTHVPKSYVFSLAEPLRAGAEETCLAGMTLGNGESLKPASLVMEDDRTRGSITLTEGKYHQIKRMMGALGNRVTALERVSFGGLTLDPALTRGEWRYLTEEEITSLRASF